jgi:hypothetical protein
MTKEDRMLQLVLNDVDLSSYYEYTPDDFRTIQEAFNAENPVVQVVAKIVRLIENDDKSKQKEVYTEVFNELKKNLL